VLVSISSIKGALSFLGSLSLLSHLFLNSIAPFYINFLDSRACFSISLAVLCGNGLSIPVTSFSLLISKSEFLGPFVSSSIFGSSSLLSSSMATLLNPFGLAAFSSFLAALGGASSVIVVPSSSSTISVTSVLSSLAC
jgi:hypothetical protein